MRKGIFLFLLFCTSLGYAQACVDEGLARLFADEPSAATPSAPSVVGSKTTMDLGELRVTYPEISKTLEGISPHIKTAPPIDHPNKIPFAASDGFRFANSETMLKRASELDEATASTITNVYNRLNSNLHMELYLKSLHEEASLWMARKGRPQDIKLLEQGLVSEQAIAVTIIRRMKKRGDTNFTTIAPNEDKFISYGIKDIDPDSIVTENDAFRLAVKTGPFIDNAFVSTNRYNHGQFTHLIQRDMVHQVVNESTGGKPEIFWNFLGTKKGINWWADLFDSGDRNSITSPETLNQIIHHSMLNRLPVESSP